ncbi:hypothetical protein Q3G72_000881 [Acer saccharum]|nr:hypothetical protein Q3G72_000881 [Acer saccharum]
MLVSYGKQGNRNQSGARNGGGNYVKYGANVGMRNRGYAKNNAGGYSKISIDNPRSSYDRKTGGETNEVKHGSSADNMSTKLNLKNGRAVKNIEGNRFEILNEEVEELMNEGSVHNNSKPMSNKTKGKAVLSKITNPEVSQNSQPSGENQDSASVLRQLHTEVQHFENKGMEVVEDCPVKNNSMFEEVAFNLEEAMADILE